jgi:hypothetical protein
VRADLRDAERASGSARADALRRLADQLDDEASGSRDPEKMRTLAAAVQELARG